MLQYDKIYQSLKKVSAEWHAGHIQWEYYWDYLKFYEDGTVIYCSSSQNKNELDWFDIHNKYAYLYKGIYNIEPNNKIQINMPAEIGALVFKGNILKKSLILNLLNTDNQYSNWEEYK